MPSSRDDNSALSSGITRVAELVEVSQLSELV